MWLKYAKYVRSSENGLDVLRARLHEMLLNLRLLLSRI
jgi:hypothetical protein